MGDADERVDRLILHLLHNRDTGWKRDAEPPLEHFAECPDVVVNEAESQFEMWFDTGVEATRLTARLSCPHRDDIEWEWADLGELPDLIAEMDSE